jgi:hypothetical protein
MVEMTTMMMTMMMMMMMMMMMIGTITKASKVSECPRN